MTLAPEALRRYARHLTLPQLGEAGQVRLASSRVLLVGAGGLGSPAALYLAAAGVGTIGVVDDDVVDESNLQRQVLHGTSAIGRPKLESARARLADLNPLVEIEPHPVRLTAANALDIVRRYDVVVDGSDNFPTRYLINDACVLTGRPDVYGAIYRFEGQVSVFAAEGGPCYRCLFRDPPPPELVPSCEDAGVLGVVPGVVGSLQALEAIKLLAGIGEPLVGRLLLFDGLKGSTREMPLSRDPECPVCGQAPTVTELIDYDAFCGLAAKDEPVSRPENLSAADLAAWLADPAPPVLVDIREDWEWNMSHIEGARHVPMSQWPGRVNELPKDTPVVLYCRSGQRSARALQFLHQMGYDQVSHLAGGILAWADDVDESVGKY